MAMPEQIIRERAFARIAEIFNIPIEQLQLNSKFGEDLKASFVSDFRANEFDIVDQDIHDAADRKITSELSSGRLTIRTVKEYCDHMVRCYATRPAEINRILRL